MNAHKSENEQPNIRSFSSTDHNDHLTHAEVELEADHVSMSRFTSASRHQFFEGADRGQVLDVLPLLSFEEKNCILIEADQGFGKTSLAHQVYVQTLEREHQACMVHGSELATSDDSVLLQTLAQHLKIKPTEAQALENGQSLAKAYLACSDKQLVLVIDDAQQLSGMAVTLLMEFLGQLPISRVQLVFFALAKAPVLLADSTLQDYLTQHGYQVTLRAFNSRETSDYVRFLLIASERESVKLSRQAMSRIFQISAGVPAKVNEALVYALQDYDQQPEVNDSQRSEIVPKWHLISLSLVAVGVLALILFGNPEPSGERFSETVRAMPEAPAPSYPTPPIRFTDAQQPQAPRPLQSEPAPGVRDPITEPLEGQADSVVSEGRVNEVQDSELSQPEISLNSPSNERVSDLSTLTDAPAPEESRPEQVRDSKVSMDAKIAKLRERQQSANVARATTSSPQSNSESAVAGWVKGMAPSHYTLQLLGGANKDAIQEFVKANGSYRKMGYFETQHDGKPWYVVVYGDFASRAQAVAAVDQLPNQLRSSKPWPRSAADIQAQME